MARFYKNASEKNTKEILIYSKAKVKQDTVSSYMTSLFVGHCQVNLQDSNLSAAFVMPFL